MNINYKIIEVYEDNRVMVVRYFTDVVTEQDLDVDPNTTGNGTPKRCKSDVSLSIPLPEPTEEELHKIILRNAPINALKTTEQIRTNPNTAILSVVHTMKNKSFKKTEKEIDDLLRPLNKPLTDNDIKKIVDQIK